MTWASKEAALSHGAADGVDRGPPDRPRPPAFRQCHFARRDRTAKSVVFHPGDLRRIKTFPIMK